MPVDQKRWQKTSERFYGRQAVKYVIKDGTFVGLSGRDGDIWEYAPGTLRAIVANFRTANRILKARYPHRVLSRDGDETLFTFPQTDLPYFAKMLRVPRDSARQLRHAISFSALPRKTSSLEQILNEEGVDSPFPCSEAHLEYTQDEETAR